VTTWVALSLAWPRFNQSTAQLFVIKVNLVSCTSPTILLGYVTISITISISIVSITISNIPQENRRRSAYLPRPGLDPQLDKPLVWSVTHGYCNAKPTATFPAIGHRCRVIGTKYMRVNILTATRPGFEPETAVSQLGRSNNYTTTPHDIRHNNLAQWCAVHGEALGLWVLRSLTCLHGHQRTDFTQNRRENEHRPPSKYTWPPAGTNLLTTVIIWQNLQIFKRRRPSSNISKTPYCWGACPSADLTPQLLHYQIPGLTSYVRTYKLKLKWAY